MNRKIKFRAWNPSTSTMFNWARLLGSAKHILFASDGYHWMQFTGLRDSNGQEIYEGDVIHASGNNKNYAVEFKSYEWDDEGDEWHHGWCLQRSNGDLTEPLGNQEEATLWLTVIGNIYENPEMMEAI